jgi:hypothetical protein
MTGSPRYWTWLDGFGTGDKKDLRDTPQDLQFKIDESEFGEASLEKGKRHRRQAQGEPKLIA